MTSEIGRMFKCLKNKPAYHTLQDSHYSHINPTPTDDSASEEITPQPAKKVTDILPQRKKHSVESLSEESSQDNGDLHNDFHATDELSSETGSLSSGSQGGTVTYQSPVIVNSGTCKDISNTNTALKEAGGILSFLGLKFSKSSTRHLDRTSSGGGDSLDKGEACNPNRYTKFPLRGSNIPESVEGAFEVLNPDLSCSYSKSSVESGSNCSSEIAASITSLSDNSYDTSQTTLNPHIKVLSNCHRSSPRNSTKKGSFSPSNFLPKSICSLGKKSGLSIHKGPSSRPTNFISRRKSKSDNNLNRVDLNCNVDVTNARDTNAIRSVGTSSQNIYCSSESGSELRLNSVQIGDHATIHLPWTGIQRNNLSGVTSERVHRNTHNNNFDSVRYIECGFVRPSDESSTVRHKGIGKAKHSPVNYSVCAAVRRSKSLEREAGCRIQFNSNSCTTGSAGTLVPPYDTFRTRKIKRSESKLDRERHVVGRCLTPEEQEVLLRNISWDTFAFQSRTASPPPRPEKPASLRNKIHNPTICSSTTSKCSPAALSPTTRPPLLGTIPRSAPNSFSNSSDSNESVINYSAPPSPPPRPLSTLHPDSRIIPPKPKVPSKTGVRQDKNRYEEPRSKGKVFADYHVPRSTPEPVRSTPSPSFVPPSSMASIEDSSSRFINKPMKGWLHSDQLLSKEGVIYTVRYIGCLDVNKSMKSLDFETRSLIAKECINQVCEAAGLKSVDRKRKMDRSVMGILGSKPRLDNAGTDVRLTITSTCLKLTSLDNGAVIASHEMPNISFASGGDATMLDFVAYVAKDPVVGRACFILECGSGLAQDVIVTIGQAFELRFKEFVQRRAPTSVQAPYDREYYNDLPGKLPPEPQEAHPNGTSNGNSDMKGAVVKGKEIPSLTLPATSEMSVNLIDFEAPTPPAFGPTTQEKNLESLLLGPDSPSFPPAQSTSSVGTGLGLPNSPSQPQKQDFKDPFDMQPFATDLSKSLVSAEHRKQLEAQPWFHGSITRAQAEKLMKNDGDYLVRESLTTVGQYVLTGIQNGCPKHLLLVDPSGVVRTKDQTFDNVIHLIHHHSDNCLPIISAESMVILSNPVIRSTNPPH